MTGAATDLSDGVDHNVEASSLDTDPRGADDAQMPPRLSVDDWIALALCAALATIVLPFTQFPDSTPRTAVVLAALPLGLVGLLRSAVRRDRAALAAAAFASWAVVCAFFSDSRWVSLLGSFGRDTSALIVAAGFGLWSIGRSVTDLGRVMAARVLLACLALSAAFGLLQIVVRNPGGGLVGLVAGRAHGLGGGHIYFGATMAGAACVSAVVFRRMTPLWFASIVLFAGCANLSGSRFPIAVGLVVGVVVLALDRDLKSIVAWLATYVGAVLVSSWGVSLIPGTESAADRAGSEAAGRMDAWRYAWSSFLDRPITGWGPLGFRGAVQGRFTPDFTAHHAANELSQIWWDAHNIVVGVAVSYGVVGLILLGWFAVLAIRHARGPLAVFVSVVSLTWLLEPAGIATFPLVMLCLGVAMSTATVREHAAVGAALGRIMMLLGGVLAMLYLLTDIRLHSAMEQGKPDAVASAASWAPWDSVAANTAAAAYANFDGSEPALRSSLVWMERARARQPDFPFYSNKIAQLNLMLGDTAAARDAVDTALELQPWNVTSLQLKYVVAKFSDDQLLMEETKEQLCTLGPQFWQEDSAC